MEVKLPSSIAQKLPPETLRLVGIEPASVVARQSFHVNLRTLGPDGVSAFRENVLKHASGTRGVKPLVQQVDTYVRAVNAPGDGIATGAADMEALLGRFLEDVPGHRVYKRTDDGDSSWLPFYVNRVKYVDSEHSFGEPHVSMELLFERLGKRAGEAQEFEDSDCVGRTPEELLAEHGFVPETTELRAAYERDLATFERLAPLVGHQYTATGSGEDNVDGNGPANDQSRWRWGIGTVDFERDARPTRVVVDVFMENPKDTMRDSLYSKDTRVDTKFWKDDQDAGRIEVPVHPVLVVFSLEHHMRLSTHVTNLTPYEYDTTLGDKLVLPSETKRLLRLLITRPTDAHKDVVNGKSGGTIVLCVGKPGLGKTLSAEVYAEALSRPLYSVQAAQLGVTPTEFEAELRRVLARAKRWNAIVLLDEADVYIRKRGTDIAQNAIVGAILRVLEYHAGVMFLTTNRGDDVDDAVESRCLARIQYEQPSREELSNIWRILARTNNVTITDEHIDRIVTEHGDITGRDVKLLLKLATLEHEATGERRVTPEDITFARRFKPTRTEVTAN